MPYKVGKKTMKGWPVYNQMTGELKGYSKSKRMALAHMRALYANSQGK